jgi:ATP-dependent Clp endopeptidase proteolytic subunit ClpP
MKDYQWGLEEETGTIVTVKKVATPTENHEGDEFNLVEFSNNKVYFYSGVSRPKVLKLNKAIVNMNNNLSSKALAFNTDLDASPIRLHINSYGGSVFAGLSAVDYILNSRVPVHTIIDGCAASAATLMSVVGQKRFIHKNACMLVHQLSGVMWGKFQEMQDDMLNSEMLMKKIKNIYRQYTKIPEDKMDEILKHDIWWDAEQCLEYGLVDEII